jgi:hypothetical protein
MASASFGNRIEALLMFATILPGALLTIDLHRKGGTECLFATAR